MTYLRHPLLSLALLYTSANALLLTNNGRYWDEHLWLHILDTNNYGLLWSALASGGFYALYYLLHFFAFFPHPLFAMHATIYLVWLLSGILLYLTAHTYFKLSTRDSFFISAFFILSPLSLTKINTSVLNFSVCIFLFYLAAYIYFASMSAHRYIRAGGLVIAALLFFFSFFMNSLLVLYGGFLLLVWLTDKHRAAAAWRHRFAFLIALPVIFWIGTKLLGASYGVYAGHNSFISLGSVFSLQTINNVWDSVAYGFFWPFVASVSILDKKIFAAIFIAAFALAYAVTQRLLTQTQDDTRELSPLRYAAWGILFFALGSFAYLAVGKAPDPYGFDMRQALLLPLGAALLTLGLIRAFLRERWQALAQISIFALFITFNTYNYYWLDMDWYRQVGVVSALEQVQDKDVAEATTIVFHDNLRELNWQRRTLSPSDYYGLTQMAFSRDDIIVVGDTTPPSLVYETNLGFSLIKPFDYTVRPVDVLISSNATNEIMTVKNWLSLKYQELFGSPEAFNNAVNKTFIIKLLISAR